MEGIILLIIIIVLWKYIPKKLEQNTNKESSKNESPGIFSNISEGNDDYKSQKPPKFQINPHLFTVDGLDRFFDSMIEFIKTGKVWELIKNWLQKSKIELRFFYIGTVIIFLLFFELIFVLGIIMVIIYFAVKKIKNYRDKNPGFNLPPSPIHISQSSTYGVNDFDTAHVIRSDYPEMMKSLLVPVLKRVGKYLWYIFLFLVTITYIIYKFFLPTDIQKEVETEVLTYGFAFRLGVWNIDPPNTGYDFGKDATKRCAGYVHTEICESVVADAIDNSTHGRKSVYEYCLKSENMKKEYCIDITEQEKLKLMMLSVKSPEVIFSEIPKKTSFITQEFLYTIPNPQNGGTHVMVKNGKRVIMAGGLVIGEEKYPELTAIYLPAYSFDGKTFAYIFEEDGRKFVMLNGQKISIQRFEGRYDSIEDIVLSPRGDYYALLVKMLNGKYIVNIGGWETEEYDSISLFKNPEVKEGIGFQFLGEKGGVKYLIIAGMGSIKYNPMEHGIADIHVPVWMGSSAFTGAFYK